MSNKKKEAARSVRNETYERAASFPDLRYYDVAVKRVKQSLSRRCGCYERLPGLQTTSSVSAVKLPQPPFATEVDGSSME